MHILITGTPGTGKTSLAKWLSKKTGFKLINEKNFSLKKHIAEFEGKEIVIPLNKLKKNIEIELKKNANLILEGHLLAEIKLKVDICILLKANPEIIEKRLVKRKYSYEKALDNAFCEETSYCKKHARRNYKNIIEVQNNSTLKKLQEKIIKELKRKGLNVK